MSDKLNELNKIKEEVAGLEKQKYLLESQICSEQEQLKTLQNEATAQYGFSTVEELQQLSEKLDAELSSELEKLNNSLLKVNEELKAVYSSVS